MFTWFRDHSGVAWGWKGGTGEKGEGELISAPSYTQIMALQLRHNDI